MDIDHFKKFNDTYGHDVGDRFSSLLPTPLLKNSRPFDVMGRWGGEEFIGILRNVGREQLEDLGNEAAECWWKAHISHWKDKTLHVTISIGATLMRHDDTMDRLIKRADNASLRKQKRGKESFDAGINHCGEPVANRKSASTIRDRPA